MADENIVQTNIVATSNMNGLVTDLNRVSLALTKLQQQLLASNKGLTTQISAMNRSFAETLRTTGQFSTHFVSLKSDVDKFGQQLDRGQLKLGQFFRVYGQHAKTSGGLIRDLAKQQVQLQNAILQPLGKNAEGLMQYNVHIPKGLDAVKNKAAIARQELMIMNKVVQEGANQLINWGKNTQWAGRQLTVGLTVPMAAFGKAAADAFRQADEQLVRLTKVYGGLAATSSSELAKIRKDVSATATELSKAYGSSFNETLGLAADIAATGKQGNELLGSIKETTRLAVLGEVDRQEAMKATLAIQSAFKENTQELSDSINFLNAVENQTSTTLNDLVEAIPKAGPVVKGLGGDVKDLALYLTAMREGGISASEGANALKSSLASLINPTKVATEMFSGLGIDLKGIVSDNAGNLTKTLLTLQAALDKLDPLQKQQAIEQLFGKFQFSRLNALFENLGKQGSQTLQVLDLMKASTSDLANIAGRELTQVTESASGKYKRAVEGLKADLAGIGEQFLKISTTLLNIVDGVIKFADKLPDPIKKVLSFLGLLTATAGPLIMLTGVLGNFFGYIIKGVYHFKALFKGAEGWKMLTPEILAANKAGDLAEDVFYSDAKAAAILKQALDGLIASYTNLEARVNAGAISTNPLLNLSSAQVGVAAREVDPRHPLLSPKDTRSMSHLNPVSKMTPDQRLAQTLFGTVPGAPKVNQKIGGSPQIYATGDLPPIEGLTRVGGVSTGVVAEEAAKWHAMTGALAMQSKGEIVKLKSEVAATGLVTDELSASYGALLPEMTKLTQSAAQKSAGIVAELQAGKITMDQARAKIIALNAEIEAMMVSTTSQVAGNLGRTVDVSKVPLLNQPVIDPKTGKSNMKELLKPGRTRGIFNNIARALGVKTYGAPYSIETTRPRRFAFGTVGLNMARSASRIFSNVRNAQSASRRLRAFNEASSKFSGTRVPNLRPQKIDPVTGKPKRRSGSSTGKKAEEGSVANYGQMSNRKSPIWEDEWIKAAGMTPTNSNEYLIHGFDASYYRRTQGLDFSKNAARVPADRLGEFGLGHVNTAAPYLEVLPGHFVKNNSNLNNILGSGQPIQGSYREFVPQDMVSLLMFLKSQGLSPQKAVEVARRAANVLNHKMMTWGNKPMSEAEFGRILNNASVRGIRSAYIQPYKQVIDPFASDAHSRNRGYSVNPAIATEMGNGAPGFSEGVTKLPGFGGGDTVPALLEPGESVVTKTGTAANQGALTLMNNGVSVDKMLGLNKGIVGLKVAQMQMSGWLPGQASSKLNYDPATGALLPGPARRSIGTGFASQMAGSMVGGAAGGAIGGNTGSIIGSIGGMFAPQLIGKMVTLAKNAGGFLQIIMKIGKVLKSLSIPGAIITVLALAGKKLWDMHKAAEAAGKANRLAFGGTSTSYASVGIKNYISLTDRLKQYNEQLELNKAKVRSAYESFTKSGPTGITFTIKELNAAIKNAKQNQKEYVDAFNNIDSSRVKEYAASLKAQFVAMGMSSSDAANQIYAIVKASDKADQALEAVASSNFKGITDRVSALKVLVTNLGANLGKTFNAEEFAGGIDALVNGALGYAKSLEGTKDKNGEILDQTDSLVKAIDQIGKLQGKNNALNAEQLLQIKKVNISYANILGTAETLQSVTAKILLYQSGMSEIVNLAGMGAKEAVAFAKNLNIVQDTMAKIFSNTSSANPLSGLATALKNSQANADKASNSLKSLQKFDKAVYEEKIKQQEKLIDKIEKEREARLKLLDVQEKAANFETDVKSAQIRYQEALAAGDMAQAAQEQLNIQRLTSDRQRELARQSINDKYDREREKAEKEIERLQGIIDAAANATTLAGKRSETASNSAATIKGFMDGIQSIITKYIGQDGKMSKALSSTDKEAIAVIINEMKKSSDKLVKEQGLALEKQYQTGNTLDVVGGKPTYGGSQFNPDALISSLTSYLDKNGGAANKQFTTAVDKFAAAVAQFAGPTGQAFSMPTKSEKKEVTFGRDSSWMLFQNAKGKKISIYGKTNTFKDIYADAVTQGWAFQGYTTEGIGWNGEWAFAPKGTTEVDRTKIPKAAKGGLITHYGLGGGVSGPGTGTSDSIPAMLSNGEYVINAQSASNIGYPVLDTLNKFAKGGMVRYDIPKMNMGGVAQSSGQNGIFGDTITMGNIIFNMNELPQDAKKFGADFIAGIKSGDRNRVYRS